MDNHFWFEAQTGALHFVKPKVPSNYYRYKLPMCYLARVKLAVEKAEVGTVGLNYPNTFLLWLDEKEVK